MTSFNIRPQLPLRARHKSNVHVSVSLDVVVVAVANTDNVVDDSSSKTVICHSLRHSHNHNRSQTRSQRHDDPQSPFCPSACRTNYNAVCATGRGRWSHCGQSVPGI